MSFTVGQQIANGEIVIAEIRDDGWIKVTFPNTYTEPSDQPLSLTFNPNVTEAFLISLLNSLKP